MWKEALDHWWFLFLEAQRFLLGQRRCANEEFNLAWKPEPEPRLAAPLWASTWLQSL